eukprot:5840189-Prymnesium_polylepis.1
MELEQDEQPASVELRVAAAAAPHKRRAVSAATAVGAVGACGKQPGEATEITGDTPARHGGRVERRGARGAQRRLAPCPCPCPCGGRPQSLQQRLRVAECSVPDGSFTLTRELAPVTHTPTATILTVSACGHI